jgi:hypothetical protein
MLTDKQKKKKRLQRVLYSQTPEAKEVYRRTYLKYTYGITLEQYNQMFEEQNHRCAICSKHQDDYGYRFAVDHDKETKKVRGLLCRLCNSAIGLLKHDIAIIDKASEYLEKNK